MGNVEWGPWRWVGLPELGDYVQVEVLHKTTNEYNIVEGWVIKKYGEYVELDTKDNDNWWALAWRKAIFRDYNPPLRQRKEEKLNN